MTTGVNIPVRATAAANGEVAGQRRLRIALAVPYYDPRAGSDPESVAADQDTLAGLLAAFSRRHIAAKGFQLFGREATMAGPGDGIEFVPASSGGRLLARLVHRFVPRYGPPYYEPAIGLARAIRRWRPDVIHLFGLTLAPNNFLLTLAALRSRVPTVLSYHGGSPARDPLTRRAEAFTLRHAHRALFTAREQAAGWLEAGMLESAQIEEVLETSTLIRPVPRAVARDITGIRGDPACVMACRLHPVKDPVTVLVGFALVAESLPGAHLTVFGLPGPLENVCRALPEALRGLSGRVTFREARPRPEMAGVLSAADYLLQASRREWSGLAVIEALACGTPVVVTDLPPLVRITGRGPAAHHFPVGDPAALAAGLLCLEGLGRAHGSGAARARFNEHLSFDALAGRLAAVYGTAAGSAAAGPGSPSLR